MIELIAVIPGIAVPAIVGWLMLDVLEWNAPVLWKYEKWVMGFVLGLTTSMYCAFLGNVFLGIPLTLYGFLGVYAAMIVPLGAIWWVRRGRSTTLMAAGDLPGRPYATDIKRWTRDPMMIGIAVLGGWVALRWIAMAVDVLLTPTFFDDAMDNWNLRGKIFFLQKSFSIGFPWDPNPGVSSYPPALSLSKTWLSTLAGSWNEGLVNGIHIVWFACLLLLVYWTLRRRLPMHWAALGMIILASLPLELIQGMSPYADVFLSLHLFIAISLVFNALRGQESPLPSLRLAGFAIALIPFTKNEGWALYFPVLALLFAASLAWLTYHKRITNRDMMMTALLAIILTALVAGPWIGFKMAHGLAFGNAKGLDLHLQWQPGAFSSIVVNTFFEGNWGLLFPLFFGLLIGKWHTAFRSPLVLLSVFILVPYLAQLFIYHFTGLSIEAIMQTGYARGLIHLMPAIVTLTALLLHDVIHRRVESGQRKAESGE